jgi:hypothetical protein
MKPQTTLRRALEDPQLLDMGAPSWTAWRALLLSVMGEALNADELQHFRTLTQRYKPPSEPVAEFWAVVGRRGGKSRATAALAVFIAALCEHKLSPGEIGRVVIVAGDREQASICVSYARGILERSPILRQMIARQTSGEIELKSGIRISVHTSSFRRVRGVTALACILDEIAFFFSDDTANPDSEVVAALRPTLATTGGPLIAISSPYARKGEMWSAYQRDFGPNGDARILVAQGGTEQLNLSGDASLQDWITRQRERDPASAAAEVDAQFRTDVESFVSLEVINACVDEGELERRPLPHFGYTAFCDPSGGSSDSMTLAISHVEGAITVVDLVREVPAPFSPQDVVANFCKLLKEYRCTRVFGDRYGAEWVAEAFAFRGVTYEHSELNRSELYISLLAMLNSKIVALVDHPKLSKQLLGLERRTGRLGRDTIDHGRGAHDDVANAVAGAVVLCNVEPLATSVPGFHRVLVYPNSGII